MTPLLLAAAVLLQAPPPKVAFSAEYMGHAVFAEGASIYVPGYVGVELEVIPAKDTSLMVSQNQFTLRVNGKRPPLLSQSPAMVAASIKYPDWEQRPTLEASAGVGSGAVIVGRPGYEPRFPGDQSRRPLPPLPRAPEPVDPSGIVREQKEPQHEIVAKVGLPEGEASKPVKGYLYFPHRGKPGSIKKLELLYNGPGGEQTIVLLAR